ncbi:TonB-dependent receptor [Candidatus Methylomicrobium oryzae]|uniref:TonB-dependent receptor n=1 Tax=Candidatus Methylomicrobium oryzae TaxID=2802053 RepID=UPI00192345A7|nr:TonB-dependent siderophore receptor [Methylomicrobium sp. RS1]MBL1264862.1 TonB-dependent siderophore receptor [Methylomicrobium sp. RS1]
MSEKSTKRAGRRWRVGALLPLGAALSGMAMAADVTPPDANEEIVLKDVKVKAARDKKEAAYKADSASTGSKIAMPIRDIPQSISVVKKELIQSQNAFNLRDALKNVSGLTIAAGEGGRTGDSITLRGFSANSDQYLDGVKENGQYSRDTFFLERAEVLKGASSILFGRGATGGVINQIFKKPTGRNQVIGDFTYGMYDFKRSSIDAETAYDDLAARLNLMWQDSDSFRDYNYNNRWGIAPSFRYKISADTELTANLLHQEESGVFDYGVPMYKGKPADVPINTYYGFPDNQMQDTDVNVGTVALSHRFNDEFSVKNTVRYGEYDRKYLTHLFGAVTDTGLTSTVARTQALRGNHQENLYNQTDFVLKKPVLGFDNTLMFGAEFGWENYDFKSKNSIGVTPISIFNPVLTPSVGAGLATDFSGTLATNRYTETRTYAGYLMDQFELTSELKLLGGVRYDVFSASQDDRLSDAGDFGRIDRQWNPRAGIVWQPTKAQSYYFSYGTSFNPSAEAFSLAANTANIPPEKNRNFEIGAKYDLFDGRLSATAALFRLEKTNARTASPTNPDLTVLSGEQRTDGFELGLAGEILPRLDLSMTYAYLDAEVTKSNSTAVGTVSGQTKSLQGMIPVNVPRHSGVTWLSYHLTDAWEIGGGVFYSSERHTDTVNEVTLPGYARLDAVVAYHQKHYDVQLNVFNLTDTVYYESGQTRSALPGAPVSGQLSVRLKY